MRWLKFIAESLCFSSFPIIITVLCMIDFELWIKLSVSSGIYILISSIVHASQIKDFINESESNHKIIIGKENAIFDLTNKNNKLSEDIEDVKQELSALRKKYTDTKTMLKAVSLEYENASKTDIEIVHKQIISDLFPEKKINNLWLDISDFEKFSSVRKELASRYEKLSEYHAKLLSLERGLKEKRYSPYIYTTLAEAYSNRIIADYYRGILKQSEIIPPIARISAELQTLYLEALANKIDWGDNAEREKKVTSIRELRKDAKEKIESANYAKYQLEYLLALYPQLEDILDVEYADLDIAKNKIPSEEDHDYTRDYLSKEEYNNLSITERNQLALDRYIESRKKTKWQLGRDYELYIGYLCEKDWLCAVEYTGSLLRFEDLGRDLIVNDTHNTYIVQCKYWSKDKTIHEKHIFQLFGTVEEYKLTQPNISNVMGVFVTSTVLSEKAKIFADRLGIKYYESVPLGDFPRIKCNINVNKEKIVTYIYHLPMDLSYDVTKINNPGEFMAFTVKEAEDAGFRRSYKWHG